MSTEADCPFCHLKQRVLKENRYAHAFLSNPRKVRGHFLVIPKRHVEKPWELSREERLAIFDLILFIQEKIIQSSGGGCDVRENYRPYLPQGKIKVDHIHYHIYPRSFDDEIHIKAEQHEAELFKELTSDEHAEMARIIKD